jgi:hypothetical protein
MTRGLRERRPVAADDTQADTRPLALGPYDEMAGWLRGLAIALAVALFLAFSGAFGTLEASLPRRLAYWVGTMLVGALLGGGVARFFFPRSAALAGFWRLAARCALASLAMSAPFTLVAWGGAIAILGSDMPASRLPILFLSVFMVALAVTALNTLVEHRRSAPPEGEPPKPVRFLERLPPRLRGAAIWAVEAEDHYLRLHTSRGQDLILMRLADAVDELEGLDGAQVHRSWWVARDAVRDVRRGDGRAVLSLPDGLEVPVSRTYGRVLREAGWY